MSVFDLDLKNENKEYLDEKELFVLYSLLRQGSVSTLSGIFVRNPEQVHIPPYLNEDESKKYLEKEILNKSKVNLNRGSHMIFSYLLSLGKMLDKKGFKISCNADYALVEGGFLTDACHNEMYEYRRANEAERKKITTLTSDQKDFLDKYTNKEIEDDVNLSIQFTQLAHPPIQQYREAILEKKSEQEFIKLVNKLITDYDGGNWDENDLAQFIKIYFEHNKKNRFL